jgi:ATP-dependent Lon protease
MSNNEEITEITNTPIKAIIKNGKLTDIVIGTVDEDDSFIETNSNNSEIIEENTDEILCLLPLPTDWYDDQLKKDRIKNDEYSEKYDQIKILLNERDVYIKDILDLDVNNDIKADLMEKYSNLRILEGDPLIYIKYRDNLKMEINNIKNNQSSCIRLCEIKKELDNYIIKNDKSLEEKILELDIDINIKSLIYKKYKILSNTHKMDHEYNKLNDWIECAIDIPYGKMKSLNPVNLTINQYLTNTLEQFDKHLYGMEKIKEELLLIINKKLIYSSHNILGLVGPPGVGKTEIVRLLANILNLPFEQISLGGLDDVSVLDGHSYTYEGSRCGRILSALKRMKCMNGIIFFDELDKIPKTSGGQAVSNLLIHITDFTQNSDFRDRYLQELPVDLSNIWFIFALNDTEQVDKILKDRLNIIKVDGYNKNQRLHIVKNFFFPSFIKNSYLNIDDIIIEDDVIKYIIEIDNRQNKNEGLRSLKFKIEDIIKKLSILKSSQIDNKTYGKLKFSFEIDNFALPIKLTKSIIDKFIYVETDYYNPMYR